MAAVLSVGFSILAAVLVLGIIIMIHELGHFLMGRAMGIGVVEFGIGFGPKLIAWERKGTKYSIRALPIGGFTQFLGEDEDNRDPAAMNNQPVRKRMLTILAGPILNILTAIILSAAILFSYGEYNTVITPTSDTSMAVEAGMSEGDRIISVDGKRVIFSDEARAALMASRDDGYADVVFEREGREYQARVGYQDGLIGITMQTKQTYGLFESIGLSFRWVYNRVAEMVSFLTGLFAGTQSTEDVGGVVAIVDILGQAARYSFESVLIMAAIISINLGIMNLLPLPALDGGRIVFLIVEAIRKKPIHREREGMVHFIGIILLLGLMVLITYNDIARLIGG
ncbi:MAG: RIP metalloprotease RseP [Christensenellales bacterium]|jgi:regulator of sigma E protease